MKLPLFRRDVEYERLVDRAAAEASTARQLALYDPETGLFASWYFALRCPEECYRAVRYNRPLTLVLIEVRNDVDDFYTAVGPILTALKSGRRSDIPTHLGAGLFALLLPETDTAGANVVAARYESLAHEVRTAIASHPYDGGNQEQLLAHAQKALGIGSDLAA